MAAKTCFGCCRRTAINRSASALWAEIGFSTMTCNPALQGGDAQGRVLVMRRGDNDRIHFPGANQFLAVIEDLQAALLEGDEFLDKGIGNGLEFAPFDFARQKIIRMMAPDVAHADDAESHCFHNLGNYLAARRGLTSRFFKRDRPKSRSGGQNERGTGSYPHESDR